VQQPLLLKGCGLPETVHQSIKPQRSELEEVSEDRSYRGLRSICFHQSAEPSDPKWATFQVSLRCDL